MERSFVQLFLVYEKYALLFILFTEFSKARQKTGYITLMENGIATAGDFQQIHVGGKDIQQILIPQIKAKGEPKPAFHFAKVKGLHKE